MRHLILCIFITLLSLSTILSCDNPGVIDDVADAVTNNTNENIAGNNGTSDKTDSISDKTDSTTDKTDSTTDKTDSISDKDDDTLEGDDSTDTNTHDFFVVNTIPSAFDIWEGHVVAAVTTKSEKEATLLLLSLSDWSQMTSATNTDRPTTAFIEASTYTELGLDKWTIPTEAQARLLYNAYQTSDSSTSLPTAIATASGSPIVLKEGNNNIRYLCEDATKTFGFYNNRITAAGATVKTYHLRLVREVEVRVK